MRHDLASVTRIVLVSVMRAPSRPASAEDGMTSRYAHSSRSHVTRRVFIGSSSEYLAEAKNVRDILDRVPDVEGVLWTDVFEPGYLTFEALERMLLTCDAAVFIASPDDRTKRGHDARNTMT